MLDGSSNLFLKVIRLLDMEILVLNASFGQFSTSWCGHCVKMAPEWAALASTIHKEYRGLKVVSVGTVLLEILMWSISLAHTLIWVADCEKFPDVCKAFGVEGYPTIMLLKPQKTAEGLGFAPVQSRRV